MTRITVTNQTELDKALADGKVTEIIVNAPKGVWITLTDTRDKWVELHGDTRAEMWGNSTVSEMRENSTVSRMRGNSTVSEMWENSTVSRMWENSTVSRMWGNSTVSEMWGNSTVSRMWENSTVSEMWGNSTVSEMRENSTVSRMWENSTVSEMWGNSTVSRMWGNSTVSRMRENSTVSEMRGNSTVSEMWGNSTVSRMWGNSTVSEAGPWCMIRIMSQRVTVNGGHVLDMSELAFHDPQTWCEYHGVSVEDGKAMLYKAVDDDLRSGYNFQYPIGAQVEDDLWQDNHDCGGGLHFGPTPRHARDYNWQATRFLKCAAPLESLRPILGVTAKCKVPAAEVICEVTIDGDEVSE